MMKVFLNKMLVVFFARVRPDSTMEPEMHHEDERRGDHHPYVIRSKERRRNFFGERDRRGKRKHKTRQ